MLSYRFCLVAGLAALVLAAGCHPSIKNKRSQLAKAAAAHDVRILRDTWGVPHIFGKTDAACAFGLAYAHSEDDFATMQETVAASRGMLASLRGKDMAPLDYMTALFRIRQTVKERYEQDLTPATRALCEAYALGVNYYASQHPGEVLSKALFPATGVDVVVGFVQKVPLFFALNNDMEELFKDERPRPVSEKRADAAQWLTRGHQLGSNAFAVSPKRTANGDTYLAINSHQPWTGPVAWYETHLHSEEGLDVVGGVFPGSPVILHGHNRNLGWAHTVNIPDLCDIYALEMNPDDPDQYKFDGEWRTLEKTTTWIWVKSFGSLQIPVPREVLWSDFGPVVRRPHGVYAIRYAGMGDIRQVEQWLRMGKATTFEEWMAAMRMQALPSFNVVYADRTGAIYYVYNALLPLRAEGYDWKNYVRASGSDVLWKGYLPYDRLPQLLNPASGFVANCNHTPYRATVGDENPKPEDYAPSLGIQTVMTNRGFRILELLGADESITEEEFYAYKFDTAYSGDSRAAELVKELRKGPIPDDALTREAVALLDKWDLSAGADNPAMALAALSFEPIIRAEMFGQKPPELWATLKEKAGILKKTFGNLAVPWQEINRMHRGKLDLPLQGAPDTLHAVYGRFEDGKIIGDAGDSYILMVAWDKEGKVRSQSIHQFGAVTAHPDSPHYADQAPLFAAKKLKPVWLDEAEIRAHLEREYRPGE